MSDIGKTIIFYNDTATPVVTEYLEKRDRLLLDNCRTAKRSNRGKTWNFKNDKLLIFTISLRGDIDKEKYPRYATWQGWDSHDGAVIAAYSESHARSIANKRLTGNERDISDDVWLNPDLSTVDEFDPIATPCGLLLSSYNAG